MNRFFIFSLISLLVLSCGENALRDDDESSDEYVDKIIDETVDETDDNSVDAVYELIEVSQAKVLVDENKDDPTFHIIDVRTTSEYDGGHIPDAENDNVYDADFDAKISEFPLNDAFLVYCASGARSSGAVSTMQSLGFLEIYELKGGISSWKNAGYSVEVH